MDLSPSSVAQTVIGILIAGVMFWYIFELGVVPHQRAKRRRQRGEEQ